MYISLSNPTPEPPTSLACKLQLSGSIRYYQMSSCTLTAEDNPAEPVEVFISTKRRRGFIEAEGRTPVFSGLLVTN